MEYKVDTHKMRNKPSSKTGKTDSIDRHTKKRLIVIDSALLLTQISQDYIMLLIDLAELSDYFDVLVVTKAGEVNYVKEFLNHWMLKANVREQFKDYKEIIEEYHIMFCFTTMASREEFRKFYRADCLSR